jgi:hypothetical protein
LLLEMGKATGTPGMGRPRIGGSDERPPKGTAPKLAGLGISKTRSARWQKPRQTPRGKYEAKVKKAKVRAETEWYTPDQYLDLAHSVLGNIDLDPASSDHAQEKVRADRHLTIETNGLAQEWRGRVWQIVFRISLESRARLTSGDLLLIGRERIGGFHLNKRYINKSSPISVIDIAAMYLRLVDRSAS